MCLANSREPGGRCGAGKLLGEGAFGDWIRPVSARPGAEISLEERRYQDGQKPEISDVIDLPMLAHEPRGHQTENHTIDADYYWSKRGALGWADLPALRDSPLSPWDNGDSTCHGSNDRMTKAAAAAHHNSLWLIKPTDVTIQVLAPVRLAGPVSC